MTTVIRSTPASRAARAEPARQSSRVRETLGLLLSTTAVVLGLVLVYAAKTHTEPDGAAPPLNLNEVAGAGELVPYLSVFPVPADRDFATRLIYDRIRKEGPLTSVGALARMRASAKEIEAAPGLVYFRDELGKQRERAGAARPAVEPGVPLVRDFGRLNSSFVVRGRADFRRTLLVWSALYVLVFYAVHLLWRRRGFGGSRVILPVLHLLTGVGLIMMVSLSGDPLRDGLIFVNFAQGVLVGGALLACLSLLDVEGLFGRLSYVPLLAALCLSALLIAWGRGPAGSNAKVVLWGFQPVEFIKVLVVLFLASYFAGGWEALRSLRERTRWADLPRRDYALPVLVGTGLVLAFFFLQKDLGPALILASVFLGLYGVARGRFRLAQFGLLLLIAGFYASYRLSLSPTVAARVSIWLSPWDNAAHGGDQLAQSLWALSSGGLTGTGLGMGDPGSVPAIHTDLIMSAVGEELGFVGVLTALTLYAVLAATGLRIALRAPTAYGSFLALGVTLVTAAETLLITMGVLGLIPLSGVVSPFLSYGRSSMIANFALFGMLLAVSARTGEGVREEFRRPVRWVATALAGLALMTVGKAAVVQVARADEYAVAGALTFQRDGFRRYQYNPRLLRAAARVLTRGSIYDSRGIPLASSDRGELERHRSDYERLLGARLEDICPRADVRCYPFGERLFHLLGDANGFNWEGQNLYLERLYNTKLKGYDDHEQKVEVGGPGAGPALRYDYGELLPLLRYRYRPEHESVRRLLDRPRELRTSIDAELQLRVYGILRSQVGQSQKADPKVGYGAVVVLDAESGNVLALANYPSPAAGATQPPGPDDPSLIDRARYGSYPPGSTFKLVTAIAALRADASLAAQTYNCRRLEDGRVGNYVRGWLHPVHDDKEDSPHLDVSLERGIVVSCNAYFAQLGVYGVGAKNLFDATQLMGLRVSKHNTVEELQEKLPDASYGQGDVLVTPLQMALVAATIADGGWMPKGGVAVGEPPAPPVQVLNDGAQAALLGRAMRNVVLEGTGRGLKDLQPPVAGKTGTAEIDRNAPHSWFVGYAPYEGAGGRRIAFAVIIENGGYGGRAALSTAGEVVKAARDLGLIR